MRESDYATRVRSEEAVLWSGARPLLSRLDVELTERCNNNCVHCYINLPADDQAARMKELPEARIRDVLAEAAAIGCLTVRFTGGEPLLREDFEALYRHARGLGLRVLLFTNATLITPRLADLFARIPPLEKMEVSVYGISRESYEAVTRAPGSFEAALRGIRLLTEREVRLVVKSALLPPNRKELHRFEAWAAELAGVSDPPGLSTVLCLRGRRDSEIRNRLIRRLRTTPEDAVAVYARRPRDYVNGMRQFCARFTSPQGDRLFSCGSGVGGACLDAYGALQPCMLLRHLDCVYDLEHGTLRQALAEFFPKMRESRASNPAYLDRCARCFLKGLCEQCPAHSWMEHGTLDSPVDYLCDVAHAQARYLGLIGADEHAWQVTDWTQRLQRFVRGAADTEC